MQTAAKSDVWYPLSQLGAVLWHLATQVAGCVMAPGHPGSGLCCECFCGCYSCCEVFW